MAGTHEPPACGMQSLSTKQVVPARELARQSPQRLQASVKKKKRQEKQQRVEATKPCIHGAVLQNRRRCVRQDGFKGDIRKNSRCARSPGGAGPPTQLLEPPPHVPLYEKFFAASSSAKTASRSSLISFHIISVLFRAAASLHPISVFAILTWICT